MVKYYGAHVSSAGGFENAIKAATELNINTIQIHPSAPQQWNFKPFAEGVEDKFLEAQKKSPVQKVFFHGIYLINLASPDVDKVNRAKLSLRHYLDLAHRMKAEGVIFHVGSLKDEPDEAVGYKRAADAINEILEKAKGNARLILEVSAGGGKVIGDKMEDLRTIYEQVDQKDRVGFGLDTQHMWASGYNWKPDPGKIIAEVQDIFGLSKVWCIHLNDSKTELASRVDRHENLGAGEIGKDAISKLLKLKEISEIPVVLETPALKSLDTAKGEVENLRALLS